MNFFLTLGLFLVINFGALALGAWFMGGAVQGVWYQELVKAPWTPPGWVFGVAWFTVMATFSVFMTYLSQRVSFWSLTSTFMILFCVQWVLNSGWNYIFFNQHLLGFGLIVLILLLLVVSLLFSFSYSTLKWTTLWILPYTVWLCIATSLNAYIYFKN